MEYFPTDIKSDLDPATMQIPTDILRASLFQYELGDHVARRILGFCKDSGKWVGVSKVAFLAIAREEAKVYNDKIRQHKEHLASLEETRKQTELGYSNAAAKYRRKRIFTLGLINISQPVEPDFESIDKEIGDEKLFLYCNDRPAGIDWLITGIKGLEKIGMLSVVWQKIGDGHHDEVIYPTQHFVAAVKAAIDIEQSVGIVA